MAQQQMMRWHRIAMLAASRIWLRVKPLPWMMSSHAVARKCSMNSWKPTVYSSIKAWSKTEPGLDSSCASISFMIPRIAAISPLIRTGSQRSLSGVPLLKSIFAAKVNGLRYSCGFGLTTDINPGSGMGLSATIVAPFFFACSSVVSMRG